MAKEQYEYYISELLTIPDKIEKILEDKERIQWFAAKYANAHDVFFIGRGIDQWRVLGRITYNFFVRF